MTTTGPEFRSFSASDGYRLNFRIWRNSTTAAPRGTIVMLHGIQSHGGWYDYSCQRFCAAGYEVWFCDRRGSGLNRQQRGHAVHAERLVNDVVQFLYEVKSETAAPITLMGISWGGKVAATLALQRADIIKRLVLLYPGLVPRIAPRMHQKFLLSLAAQSPQPLNERSVPIPLDDPALFTRSPEWQSFIANDELALREVTIPFLLANRALERGLKKTEDQISCPSLLALAGADEIIDNEKTRTLYQTLTGSRGDIMEFAEARHSLEFEPNRDAIFQSIITWLHGTDRTD